VTESILLFNYGAKRQMTSADAFDIENYHMYRSVMSIQPTVAHSCQHFHSSTQWIWTPNPKADKTQSKMADCAPMPSYYCCSLQVVV